MVLGTQDRARTRKPIVDLYGLHGQADKVRVEVPSVQKTRRNVRGEEREHASKNAFSICFSRRRQQRASPIHHKRVTKEQQLALSSK